MIPKFLDSVTSLPRKTLEQWNRFWFEADAFPQLRIYRVAVGLCLLGFYLLRTLDLDMLYTNGGILPIETLGSVIEQKFAFSIFHYFPSRESIWIGHFVLIAATVMLVLGKYPRTAALVVYLLHLSFDNRNPTIVYGFNKVTTFYLFNMILASYDAKAAPEGSIRRALASVALRLTQIQLCIIYLFAGTEKLKGPLWWRGEAIWGVLSNAQTATYDFGFMAHLPLVITFATYATLVWEIYFPVLVWSRRSRYPWLMGGVLLHASIGLMMNLPFFASVMVAAYAVFLRRRHALALERWFVARIQRALSFTPFKFKVGQQEQVPELLSEWGS